MCYINKVWLDVTFPNNFVFIIFTEMLIRKHGLVQPHRLWMPARWLRLDARLAYSAGGTLGKNRTPCGSAKSVMSPCACSQTGTVLKNGTCNFERSTTLNLPLMYLFLHFYFSTGYALRCLFRKDMHLWFLVTISYLDYLRWMHLL